MLDPSPAQAIHLILRVGRWWWVYTYYLQHNHSVGHSLSVHYSYLQSNCNNHPSIRKSCGYAIYLVPTISGQPFTHSLLIPCEWLAKPLLTSPHFTSITGTSHRLLLLLKTVSADPPLHRAQLFLAAAGHRFRIILLLLPIRHPPPPKYPVIKGNKSSEQRIILNIQLPRSFSE